MNFSASYLFMMLLVSMVGLALFLYGKRDTKIPYLVIGVVMMVYPYFITNAVWMFLFMILLLGLLWLLGNLGY